MFEGYRTQAHLQSRRGSVEKLGAKPRKIAPLFTWNSPMTERRVHMRKASITGSALALALAVSLGGIASAQQTTTIQVAQAGKVSAEDQEFLKKAIQGGQAEVAISQLAIEKSQNEQVRTFAERMVKDHTAANQQLLSLEGAGGTLPKELDKKHQALLEHLSKLSGDEFDQQYMKGQVQDHQAAVKLFASEATRPSGPVDALAGELLPTLREHLQMAEEISKSMA
jgi:predicted outer membrane protein